MKAVRIASFSATVVVTAWLSMWALLSYSHTSAVSQVRATTDRERAIANSYEIEKLQTSQSRAEEERRDAKQQIKELTDRLAKVEQDASNAKAIVSAFSFIATLLGIANVLLTLRSKPK